MKSVLVLFLLLSVAIPLSAGQVKISIRPTGPFSLVTSFLYLDAIICGQTIRDEIQKNIADDEDFFSEWNIVVLPFSADPIRLHLLLTENPLGGKERVIQVIIVEKANDPKKLRQQMKKIAGIILSKIREVERKRARKLAHKKPPRFYPRRFFSKK